MRSFQLVGAACRMFVGISNRVARAHGIRRRSAARAITQYEPYEPRALMAAVAPTNFEQYMVELVNRARANPAGYAQSLGIALNEGLPAGTISTAAKQPLAINPNITDAARKHSQWMIDTDTFSHAGAGNSTSRQRMEAAGYVFHPGAIWAENLGIELRQTSVDVQALTKLIQEKLFRDNGVAGRGHRLNIMDPRFREVGIGVRSGVYRYQGTNFNAVVATQKFAKSGDTVFLTGVAFDDRLVADQFYTPGEGLGNVLIRAVRDGTGETFTTSTWASGGYSLALPPGKYSVMASGGGLGNSQFLPSVVIGTQNRKFDFRKGVVRTAPEVAVTGNQRHLRHGQTDTSTLNYTDFGNLSVAQGSLTRPFVVRNLGNAPLVLAGADRVQIVGAHRADFTIVSMPNDSIVGNGFSAFSIRFDPLTSGLRTAVVRVWSNDGDERPFRFTVSGRGVVNREIEPQIQSSFNQSQLAAALFSAPLSNRNPVASLLSADVADKKILPRLPLAECVQTGTAPEFLATEQRLGVQQAVLGSDSILPVVENGTDVRPRSALAGIQIRPDWPENRFALGFSRRLPVA